MSACLFICLNEVSLLVQTFPCWQLLRCPASQLPSCNQGRASPGSISCKWEVLKVGEIFGYPPSQGIIGTPWSGDSSMSSWMSPQPTQAQASSPDSWSIIRNITFFGLSPSISIFLLLPCHPHCAEQLLQGCAGDGCHQCHFSVILRPCLQ